ncbi:MULTISPECIES: nuclear transport factor 2 family protein [Streptomyces]|uniref:nuclear transport factor 2 family protein n=1 Tax=Streptomyces TaxID=1883 RepID=UPI00163D3CFB|nr:MULTISPECIES: nuclear transport factor 2 family protein [Streptomyces]MBC2877876.1 nuclear transport factor 2 family protein [Streptomyces sp. TYQ1024]UBI38012.1 nuclear transport factor 2 family protein [Streptomyces mobaraensis]UKW30599.1 nuclear transport factor 2 family protein [Streptomyces sp. TYQ1024]
MPSPDTTPEFTKRIAQEFFSLAFNDKRPDEAAARYLGPFYIQHNPSAPDGPEAFVSAISHFVGQFPELTMEFKRVVAEGDLVVLHSHMRTSPEDRGSAVMDIVRFEGGRIVEHWDVVQAIPETAANDNSMF